MSYENLGSLQSVYETLEVIEDIIDDENYFDSDKDKFIKEIRENVEIVRHTVREILEDDPELPIGHKAFLEQAVRLLSNQDGGYDQFQKFSVDELIPFMKEVQIIIDENKEPFKRELFDQLTIPIMSLVNHQAHPTRPGYLVYYFKIGEHATYFEELLKERDLFYERFDEQRSGEDVFWFGVREQDHDAVEIINYTVKGKFRKPMIKDKAARYVVIGFGLVMILLAILGAILSNS